jgi:2-polyprenyl-3-methyl-5-hydroxy-6-metoxy-1,4-benzoquinol methylase
MGVIAQPPCTLCGGGVQPNELVRLSFASVACCPRCRLVRTWPPRSGSELAALHADPGYFRHPYFEARRNLDRESLRAKHRELLRLLTKERSAKGLRLLDVGCDTGALLVVGRDEFGMEVAGVEVSPSAAETARREHRLEVHVGEITTLGLPAESFDLITLLDVIEHVSNPPVLLSELQRLLRPGGRLYIATADHDALINIIGLGLYRVFGKGCWPLLEKLYIPYHEFYFTKPTLARMVEGAGLRVELHRNREFPLDEFGHGLLLKAALIPIFILQRLVGRQTLQEVVAVRA